MSELDRFIGKEEEKIINGKVFKLFPLNAKDLPLILKLSDDSINIDERAIVMNKIFVKYMKYNFPDENDDNILNVSIEYYNKIMEAILEVNGYDTSRIETFTKKTK